MVDVRRENNSQVVNVVPVDNAQNIPVQPVSTDTRVNGTNDKTKYYSDLAKHYAELAEDYADNADTSSDNALISATSADNSANICTGVLENEHFQTVYTDLEGENSNIEAVGNNIENVNDVAENLSDINSVVTNLTDINSVASDLTNIDSVASYILNVNSVASDLTNIDTVKDNLTAINTNATNIVDIQNASANAQTAIAKASEALQSANNAHSSEVNAGVSEDNAEIWAEGTDEEVQALGGVHSSKGWAEVASQGQIQTDWLQSDNTKKDYIKNKPTNLSDFSDDLGSSPTHTHSQYVTDISSKQDVLVSGTNIKTINNNSILGSGDLVISGGSSRNICEIVTSTLPLTEAGLHLLDGTLINGSGSYADFVDYMANKYNEEIRWVTFTQPNATSNTTALNEGYMTCSSSGSPTSTYEAWKAFDSSPTSSCWRISSTSGWLQIKFPYQIKITGLTFYSGTSSSYLANDCQFYTSNSKTTPIGNAFQGSSSTYTSTTITGISTTGIITDTLYLDITSSRSTGISCGHIAITGQILETPQYFCSESTWQSTVTQYGVCEKFVYDQTNNTVRLPKYGSQIYTKNSTVASTVPVKGNGTTIGLTNGSNNYGLQSYTSSYAERLTAATGSYNKTAGSSSSSGTFSTGETLGLTTNASNSGIVGDTSSLLTQYPLGCYYYIVIATSTKTDIQVDIDEIATDLNCKADVDYTNCIYLPMRNDVTHITETYINGTSWYRVWSNGFIEQGGKKTSPTKAGTTSITFLKAFTDTNYSFFRSGDYDVYTNTYIAYGTGYDTKTTTGVTMYSFAQNNMPSVDWVAMGY